MIHANIKELLPYLDVQQQTILQNLNPVEWTLTGERRADYQLYHQGQKVTDIAEYDYSQKRVKQYVKHPKRFHLRAGAFDYYMPQTKNHCFEIGEFAFDINQKIIKALGIDQEIEPVYDHKNEILIISGLHLGFQVETLCTALQPRHIFIVDDNFESLYYSMMVNDWSQVTEYIEEKGATLQFFIDTNIERSLFELFKYINFRHFLSLEGLYIYQHGQTQQAVNLSQQILQKAAGAFVYNGWLEDDNLILYNLVDNYARGVDILLDRPVPALPRLLAVVAANGPSLDKDIPWLKENRDKIVLFSSGTTLQALLKNDIRPDFQVELENGQQVYLLAKRMHEQYGLEGITLISSLAMDYRANKFFDNIWNFVRFGAGGSRWFAGEEPAMLRYSSYTCTNSAIASVRQLGFRHVLFVGMDLGSADPDIHHSKSSIYYSRDEADGYLQKLAALNQLRFPLRVEGNFDDFIYTNEMMDMTRADIQNHIQEYSDSQFLNMSRGAKIHGAKPVHSSQLDLAGQIDGKELKTIWQNFYRVNKKEDYLSEAKVAHLAELFQGIFDEILAMIRDETRAFNELVIDIYDFVLTAQSKTAEHGVFASLVGSFQRILILLRYLSYREGRQQEKQQIIRDVLHDELLKLQYEQVAFCRFLRAIFTGHFDQDHAYQGLYQIERSIVVPILLKYEEEKKRHALQEAILQIFEKAGERMAGVNYLTVSMGEILARSSDQIDLFQQMEAMLYQWLSGEKEMDIILYTGMNAPLEKAEILQQRRSVLYIIALMNGYELDLEKARSYGTTQEQDYYLALYELWHRQNPNAARAYVKDYEAKAHNGDAYDWQSPLWQLILQGALANFNQDYKAGEVYFDQAAQMERFDHFAILEAVYNAAYLKKEDKMISLINLLFKEAPLQVDAQFLLHQQPTNWKNAVAQCPAVARAKDRLERRQ